MKNLTLKQQRGQPILYKKKVRDNREISTREREV